jgi:hypothetical protein
VFVGPPEFTRRFSLAGFSYDAEFGASHAVLSIMRQLLTRNMKESALSAPMLFDHPGKLRLAPDVGSRG